MWQPFSPSFWLVLWWQAATSYGSASRVWIASRYIQTFNIVRQSLLWASPMVYPVLCLQNPFIPGLEDEDYSYLSARVARLWHDHR